MFLRTLFPLLFHRYLIALCFKMFQQYVAVLFFILLFQSICGMTLSIIYLQSPLLTSLIALCLFSLFCLFMFVPICTSMDPPFPCPMIRYILSVTCWILAPGKHTTISSSLLSLRPVFLTTDYPTYMLSILLMPSITAAQYVFLFSPSCPAPSPILLPPVLFSCPSFSVLVASLFLDCLVYDDHQIRHWLVSHISFIIIC